MKRTQIYLTEEQHKLVRSRARDAGVSQAEVIRRILDEGLNIGDDTSARVAAVDATAGILPDAPDWREWLAAVRGDGADRRLRKLGV